MGRRLLLSGAGLMLLVFAACGPERAPEVEFVPPVTAREVVLGDVEDRIVATGVLRATEVATAATETSGSLIIADTGGRQLAEGDRVTKGQLLATLTGAEISVASRIEATSVRYTAAQRDLEAKRRLFAESLIPEQEVKLAEATVAEAKLELDRSRLTEDRTRITSPIDGVVLRLTRDQAGAPQASGQRVSAGFVVAEVGRTAQLIAEVSLVGPDAARVRLGLPVRLRQPASAEATLEGVVTRLAPQADPNTRALKVEVQVQNAAGQLKPGMFVEATLVVESRQGVPVIPRAAVTERDGVPVVFVLRGQQVDRREVTLGLGDDEIVEVRAGLTAGERIVEQGLETLADGARVRVTGG